MIDPDLTPAVRRRAIAPAATGEVDLAAELQTLEDVVVRQLQTAGLPVQGLFADVAERHDLLRNIGSTLAELDPDERARSYYISRMVAAGTVGLLDASLSFLWDELVTVLRRRVTSFDLIYFYDVAVGGSDLRKQLHDADDLPRVDDAKLLRGCLEIGLLDEAGFMRLDAMRHMRNHASAAHPTEQDLSGMEIATYLQNAVRYVMTRPLDTVVGTTKVLLANLKRARLDDTAVRDAAVFFDQLRTRADPLGDGLFGLYTAADRSRDTADNILRLWPHLWEHLSESARSSYGLRCARYAANLDQEAAAAARELLDLVQDGVSYLPEGLRAVELDEALDLLMDVHHGWDNFANEGPPARALARLVGPNGDVPEQVERKYVRAVVECWLGNSYNVSWAAKGTYETLLERLDGRQSRRALRAITDAGIRSVLMSSTVAQRQWTRMLDIVEPKLTRPRDRDLLAAMRASHAKPYRLHLDADVKRLLEPRTRTGA